MNARTTCSKHKYYTDFSLLPWIFSIADNAAHLTLSFLQFISTQFNFGIASFALVPIFSNTRAANSLASVSNNLISFGTACFA